MATVIGPNFDYDNLSTKSTYGFYSILKQQCTNDNTNATLNPDSTTVFKWSIPCSHKAIKLDNMRLVLKGNILWPGRYTNEAANGQVILLMSEVSPVVRYEIKTKSGQLIQRSDFVRSFVNTFYDRVQHKKKKQVVGHAVVAVSPDQRILIDGFYHANITKEEAKIEGTNKALGVFNNYGYVVAIHDAVAGTVLNEVTWSISLRDLLGGVFENEVDLILPNDMFEITLEIDWNFLLNRSAEISAANGRGAKKKCSFKLNDIYIKLNVQEDAEINKYLLDKVKNGYLLYPYEHVQTHSISKALTTVPGTTNLTLNQNIFSGSGSILRKIYLTTNFIPSDVDALHLVNYRSYLLLNKVRVYINSTYLGEYEALTFDNFRGNVNHIDNGYFKTLHTAAYNLPLYFNNPENHESKIEGLIVSPSSNYNFDIEKVEVGATGPYVDYEGTAVEGNINYDVHIITTKILYINSQGAVVMNSLEETTLNAAQIPLLTA